MSAEKIKAIGEAAFEAFKEGIDGLNVGEKKDALLAFAKNKSLSIGEQIFKSKTEDTDAKREEAVKNVKHLRGHIKIEIGSLALDVEEAVENLIVSIFQAVLSAAANVFGIGL